MKKMDRRRNLHTLIAALPTPDVDEGDLKMLALQLILDIPNDDEATKAQRARVKLGALQLLADILRNEDKGDAESALLEILGGE